jgi:hydrogenase maturation protease
MNWPLVAGLGSHHGDDQAAWLVLDLLLKRDYPDECLLRLRHPADLLGRNEPTQSLIICDACQGHGGSGTIHNFSWPSDRLVYERPSGSHDLSLSHALELGRQLDCLPATAEIWVVEGNNWAVSTEPSPAVCAAAVTIANAIWKACCRA